MTLSPDSEAWPLRFGGQLKALGELSETLTLRLLEIEQRLGCCEQQLTRVLGQADQSGEDSAAMVEPLELTDERLTRLEGLLKRNLQVLPQHPNGDQWTGEAREEVFPDDGEQPFMDELIA